MRELLGIEQDYPAKMRAQLRQAAEVMGIDDEYISRMARLFVARIAADRQLGKTCARYVGCGGEKQAARMTTFWSSIALHTDAYCGDLVAAHRTLPDLERQDFDRWMELFRATLDETAPSQAAANYLMSRTERIAKDLEAALFERARR